MSVTFVSTDEGWAFGSVPCGAAHCAAMVRTFNGGRTWVGSPAPVAQIPSAGNAAAQALVRFANGTDGWVLLDGPGGQNPELWASHDGGQDWSTDHIPGMGDPVSLETSGGAVRIAGPDVSTAMVQTASSPVDHDAWTVSDTSVPIGAGPVPSTQIVLQDGAGWLLQNDRTVVGGALLNPSAGWTAWTPPCKNANGAALIAAATADQMAAVCQEGTWGPAGNVPSAAPGSEWMFTSTDGGVTFQNAGQIPGLAQGAQAVAEAAPGNEVVASGGALVATFDNGHSWTTVHGGAAYTATQDLGFENADQGVAVIGSQLLMTRDGGHTWTAVLG
jgi:hypothetical protein